MRRCGDLVELGVGDWGTPKLVGPVVEVEGRRRRMVNVNEKVKEENVRDQNVSAVVN